MRANQLRLWFYSIAYVLMCALRRIGLHDTDFAQATCGTIRLKLLKIGPLVRISVRRIKIAMASACPASQDRGRAAIRLAIATIARAPPAGHAPPRRNPRGTNQLAHGEPQKTDHNAPLDATDLHGYSTPAIKRGLSLAQSISRVRNPR